MNRLLKPRFLLLYPLAAWLLLAAHTTERQLRVGIALSLLGLAIRFWANGYVGHVKVNGACQRPGKIGRLVTAGPYAFVRHPLYVGSVLIGAGLCVVAGNAWVILTALIFFLVVYRHKMAQEEGLLREEVGTPYLIYHAAVPRWRPSWRRYPNRQGRWCWQGIAASKEWKTAIWVVVFLTGLYFREEIVQEREWFGAAGWGWKQGMLLSLMVAGMAGDGLVELMKRSRRTLSPARG